MPLQPGTTLGPGALVIPDPAHHDATSHPEGISLDDAGNIGGASMGRTVTKCVFE